MFKEDYKRAYDSKVPEENFVQKIEEKLADKSIRRSFAIVLRPVTAIAAVCLIFVVTLLPVMAREVTALYSVIEKYVPSLAEYVLPEEYSSSSAGILMQLEAVNIHEKEAEVLVSFCDEEGFDFINGPVDLYDSYHIIGYSGTGNIGGCTFLEYNEEEDKAYFKIQMISREGFGTGKFRLQAGKLLTECTEERKVLDLSNIDEAPVLKSVTLSSAGGSMNPQLEQYMSAGGEESPRPGAKVLQGTYDSSLADKLEITAIGYRDGVLRIQNCRGNLNEADRHMEIKLVNEAGEESNCDYSVYWQEELEGEKLSFHEQWFVVSEEELMQLQAVSYEVVTAGCVKGDWEIVFRVDDR